MKFYYQDWLTEDGGGGSGCQRSRPCRYCQAPLATAEDRYSIYGEPQELYHGFCMKCGWWEVYEDHTGYDEPGNTSWHRAILSELDHDGRIEYGLTLLTNELARQPQKLYDLHPRQFELLVASVYRNLFSCCVEVTKYAKDGGKDLVCFDSDHGQFIVEVKRYHQNQRVGVNLVRQLLGVMLVEEVQHGVIITTSRFTQDALELMYLVNERDYWRIEGKEFSDVADWLRLTHDKYFDLTRLDEFIVRTTTGMLSEFPRQLFLRDETISIKLGQGVSHSR